MAAQPVNWARNIEFSAAELRLPASVEELQEIVAASARTRVLGSGHSFNRIADTSGVLVSTTSLPPVVEVVADRSVVRVAGGVRYGELAQQLDGAGYAVRNMASLPHISVAGCARRPPTAPVTPTRTCPPRCGRWSWSRRPGTGPGGHGLAGLRGLGAGLGGLGVVTTMELDHPGLQVRQFVYEGYQPRR